MVRGKNSTIDERVYAPDFELPGIDQQVHHLARYLEKFRAVGVVFLSDKCPYVQMYLDRLDQIQTEFKERGFTLIGINANDTTHSQENGLEQMKNFATEHEIVFPYIKDTAQDVARCFQVKLTPEVFVIDKNYEVCYRGAIDDSPESANSVKKAYLRDSIAALLSGKEIEPVKTKVVGTGIEWRV
ncbi:MAG: thioredoxin family protein [Prochloraceae cyanobacterium]|nr:thioredoxin family protein [Prochloraceae cyanobacterium]